MTHDPTMAKDVEQTFDDDTEFHLPKEHWPLPELIHTETPHAEPTHTSFVSVAASPEYTRLRSAFRSFAFPMTIAGLTSYFAYVFLSIFALQSGLPPDQLNALVTDNLQKAVGPFNEGNARLRAYAKQGTVLLLAASDVTEPEIQVTMGLMCEGACR